MTCIACRDEPVVAPDGTLCESCRGAELARLIERRYAELAGLLRRRRLCLPSAARRELPPPLYFLLNVMVEAGWSERAVTSAQHSLMRPETAIPAVFAHLVEAGA